MIDIDLPLPLSGYVLAGGKSTRMGMDKAMLRFRGTALVHHAVQRLRGICAEVAILGSRPDLAGYAETLPDRVEAAGPLAGIDAALHHAAHGWILIVPVDVPLLPSGMLAAWAWHGMNGSDAALARCFSVEGRAQPLVALLHRSLASFVSAALDSGERKVRLVLEAAAAQAVALRSGVEDTGMRFDRLEDMRLAPLWTPTPVELATKALWFANGNTPAEFARIASEMEEAARLAASQPGIAPGKE